MIPKLYGSRWEKEQRYLAQVYSRPRIPQDGHSSSDEAPHVPSVYHAYPIKVPRAFWLALTEAFPNLTHHQNALLYRNMLEYLLYSNLTNEEGALVFPAKTLAQMVGKRVGVNGFVAIDHLEAFSRDVFPLHISPHDPLQRKARSITYSLPEAITNLGAGDALSVSDADLVWLVSGYPVSKSSRRKAAALYEERIQHQLYDGVKQSHPAYELMIYLNAQAPRALAKRVRANWPHLITMYQALEPGARKNHVYATLSGLDDWCRNLYGPSERTVRISTRGISIHNLPRDFRKAALAGAIEMDIRSSQLAIVAKLWTLPTLTRFLESRSSIWEVLLSHLDFSAEDADAKDALKKAVYSTCFGMGRKRLVRGLAEKVGSKKAMKFFKHPLIREVLRGRSHAMRNVRRNMGLRDAFGEWVPISRSCAAHALLAQQAQSWELRLMLPVFEAVKKDQKIQMLSWLHDGVVLCHEDSRERYQRHLMRITKQAFDSNATKLGFATELEQNLL